MNIQILIKNQVIPGLLLTLMTALVPLNNAKAAVYWVGTDTETCNGLNGYETLSDAVTAAGLTSANDEIRLTDQASYTGLLGAAAFIDFKPGVKGSLIVSGGYNDCGDPQDGRTAIGLSPGETFRIETVMESRSVVTFRNLTLAGASGSAIFATGGAEVVLENLFIAGNLRGMVAGNGAFIDIKQDTKIEDNGTLAGGSGGGVFCSGTDSLVVLRGLVEGNKGVQGGNIYISNGCFFEVVPGGNIFGPDDGVSVQASRGGGVYVDQGGEFYAEGSPGTPVWIHSNRAVDGGAFYVNGTGRATLLNVSMLGNDSTTGEGAAIYAIDGGAALQVILDVSGDCDQRICSRIDQSDFTTSVIFARNSNIDIFRTLFDISNQGDFAGESAIFRTQNSGTEIRLNSVSITRNRTKYLFFVSNGKIIATHTTIGINVTDVPGGGVIDPLLAKVVGGGVLDIQNSIMVDQRGVELVSGSVFGKCNLVNDGSGMPASMYLIDTPTWKSAGFPGEQLPESPGVDMCNGDFFAFSSERDLYGRDRPVDELSNPNGNPGEDQGRYDAGAFELYPDPNTPLLSVGLIGDGSGTVVSTNVAGINCPGECFHRYNIDTPVNLLATPAPGHQFEWTGCDFEPGGGVCEMTMNEDKSPTVTFTEGPVAESIFSNGFE